MIEEYKFIMKNDVWEVVPKPEGNSIVTSWWIYKIKYVLDGCIEKYKAIFVACSLSQKYGIDHDDTSTHVARCTTVRAVISLAYVLGWKLH